MSAVTPRALFVIAFLLACATACGGDGGASDPARRPALQAVSLPDVSSAAEPVQRQLRDRFARLQAAIDRPETLPGALAAAYGDMGRYFMAAEYYDAAEACFLNALALVPGDMRWSYYLGHVYRLENDLAQAALSFERALAESPNHVPSLIWLGEMYLGQNRPDAAESVLARARSLDASSGAALYGLGRAALAQEDFARAVRDLEAALALGPHATRIHYPLALAYRGLGDQGKAEEHLRLRGDVDLPPPDPLLEDLSGILQNAAAYETRGSQAIEARQWEEAVASLRTAADLAPDNAFTRLNLGTALYMQGDADGALEQYRASIQLSPGLAKAHFGMGVVMETRGLDREAVGAFTAAVEHDPAYVEARFSLANALRRTGLVSESLPHYAEVLSANPAASQASFGMAMGLVRLGRYRDARAQLEVGMTTFPDQLGFAHALARLLAAAPDDRVRDGARALAIMADLMATQQTLATVETMAMALAEVGRFEEAAGWQRDAIEFARETGPSEMAARLTENLRLYEARQPCRTPWAADDPVHHPAPSPQ